MVDSLEELVALLDLEEIDENLYRGRSEDPGWGRLFGGHVLGQALAAAQRTVDPGRQVHSLHCYFLLAGDVNRPVIYDVDRIRDGGSFTTRRVVARQHGRAIFHLSASFQRAESGFEHQTPMPSVPPPDQVPNEHDNLASYAMRLPAPVRDRMLAPHAFEMRPVEPPSDPIAPTPRPPQRMVWIRGRGKVGDDPAVHAALLAYISDYSFIGTALLPHGMSWLTPGMQVASLDHAMWFHDDIRVDEWMLHVMDSPRASRSRGLVHGRIYAADGRLIASTAQEGLMRQRG